MPTPPTTLTKDFYCSGAEAAITGYKLIHLVYSAGLGVFGQRSFDSAFRCFRRFVGFDDVCHFYLSSRWSCRSPGVLVVQYQVGNEVFWERLDALML